MLPERNIMVDFNCIRSILYVPATSKKHVLKAPSTEADVIQLDLEDSITWSEKDNARAALEDAVRFIAENGKPVFVRINHGLEEAKKDIQAAVGENVKALTLTKVQSTEHVLYLEQLVQAQERIHGLPEGHTKFIVLIESLSGFDAMREIARCTPRIVGMSLGAEDFALDANFQVNDQTLLLPKQLMLLSAKSAGIQPIGFIGTVANLSDWAAFESMVKLSHTYGFETATCIHPDQVKIVNRLYGVSQDEFDYSTRVVNAYKEHESVGRGAFKLDGKMIDIPLLQRAQKNIAKFHASNHQSMNPLTSPPKSLVS